MNEDGCFTEFIHNFRKRTEIDSFGSEYDKFSIMHYDGYTFSANGKPTILDKSTGQPVWSQRDDLTKSDVHQVNEMYGCAKELSRGETWKIWISQESFKMIGRLLRYCCGRSLFCHINANVIYINSILERMVILDSMFKDVREGKKNSS